MKFNIFYHGTNIDGLFFYSYETYIRYKDYCNFIIIPIYGTPINDYKKTIESKYTINLFDEIVFPNKLVDLKSKVPTFCLGSETLTSCYLNFYRLNKYQQINIAKLLKNVSFVYSLDYNIYLNKAINFFNSNYKVFRDKDLYNIDGYDFKKVIYREIIKEPKLDIQFKYLFNANGPGMYDIYLEKSINYKDYRFIYNSSTNDINKLKSPINNLFGLFKSYVYIKPFFDPAPRFIQECKYFDKEIIYDRPEYIRDGGYLYYKNDFEFIDILNKFKRI